ncbi:putative oxidoreductase [Actinacidiphila reveromycinica]|uniref:Putative oxidoreductase n=1 Tax=Actinacidiphila reveromycinica TaxID=659352 RepID=A0A7U3VSA3_9ACTN|nr:putative oxidoreductase [Streptomyces sp. SN-593]
MRTLSDGTQLPGLGLGTYPMDDAEAERAVAEAIRLGYRLVDTAVNYGNEAGTGRGVRHGGVPREQIVVTTKVPGRDHGYEETLASFEESRKRLGLDYVDLYLVHWPLPRVDRYVDTWRAMVKLREEGVVRSIGVSNFTAAHIDRLERETGVLPSVDQIEMHPLFPQEELRRQLAGRGVVVESWSPLGRGSDLLADPAVRAAAQAHDRTPGQVVLRWHTQLGVVPIPKSGDPQRQRDNLDIFGFELSEAELAAVTAGERRRLGGDPNQHEEF